MKKNNKFSLKAAMLEQVTKDEYPQQTSDFAPVVTKSVSLDQLVDKYLVRYEREAIPAEGPVGPPPSETQITEKHSNVRQLISFLLEQEAPEPPAEEPPAEEPPAADAGAAPTDAPADEAGGAAPSETPVMNTPKINLNDFSRSIARLVNNYDALLNPKTIILNRAAEYIRVNYNDLTAKQFLSIMEQNYGVHATNTDPTDDDSDFPTPYSGGALISASGGAGGG